MIDRQPRKGDRVWIEQRHTEGVGQPNGTITNLDFHFEEIEVVFLDGKIDYYTFDQFECNWSNRFGGIWLISEE